MYVLELEDNKFYVGITSQTPEIRMKEHASHIRAANWTRKYAPIRILDSKLLGSISKPEAEKYEAKVVRKYMNQFGYNNVRGGDLTSVEDYVVIFSRVYDKMMFQVAMVLLGLSTLLLLIGFKILQ